MHYKECAKQTCGNYFFFLGKEKSKKSSSVGSKKRCGSVPKQQLLRRRRGAPKLHKGNLQFHHQQRFQQNWMSAATRNATEGERFGGKNNFNICFSYKIYQPAHNFWKTAIHLLRLLNKSRYIFSRISCLIILFSEKFRVSQYRHRWKTYWNFTIFGKSLLCTF